jgi:hypothetical protein
MYILHYLFIYDTIYIYTLDLYTYVYIYIWHMTYIGMFIHRIDEGMWDFWQFGHRDGARCSGWILLDF